MADLSRILVVNAGSSSLKLSVIGPGDTTLAAATVPPSDHDALRHFIGENGPIDASGHRIVHGGTDFGAPIVLDDAVINRLQALTPLAPLHQPAALQAASLTMEALPGVPAVGCFDTAFHATMPDAATTYAVPIAWRTKWGIRRFGFHGLSHQWASRRALQILDLPTAGSKVVTCHLGAGSSVCAVADGRSVDTTMGFTPLEGLVMATRSGSVDPGAVLWMIRTAGIDPAEVEEALNRRSGLAALSGTDGDMRSVEAAAHAGDERAVLALEVWAHRLRQAVASMAASLGGIDALVFTGGVGEHQPRLRAVVADGLSFLGVTVGPANGDATGDSDISAAGARCRTAVVTAREDLQTARLTEDALRNH
jgi:acetate kinase